MHPFATQLAKCEFASNLGGGEFPLKLGVKQISDRRVELELSRSEIAEACKQNEYAIKHSLAISIKSNGNNFGLLIIPVKGFEKEQKQ